MNEELYFLYIEFCLQIEFCKVLLWDLLFILYHLTVVIVLTVIQCIKVLIIEFCVVICFMTLRHCWYLFNDAEAFSCWKRERLLERDALKCRVHQLIDETYRFHKESSWSTLRAAYYSYICCWVKALILGCQNIRSRYKAWARARHRARCRRFYK